MSEPFRRAVLIDSSATLALLDSTDANHRSAVSVAHGLVAERRPVFITNHVEVETHALLLRRLGRSAAREWLFRSGLDVVRATPDDEAQGKELVARYEDKDWSLCDAISFAVIERRRAAGAFSFDRHFSQYSPIRVWGSAPAAGSRRRR